MHFFLLFLYVVASLQSSVAPPSSKTNAGASGLWSWPSFPKGPLPCLHPPLVSLTWTSLSTPTERTYLVVNSRYTSTLPIPVLGINWLCLWNVLFFQTLSLCVFCFVLFRVFLQVSGKVFDFLDATWKCHPLYFFSVKCKPFRCDGTGVMAPLSCLPEHAGPVFHRVRGIPLVVHNF